MVVSPQYCVLVLQEILYRCVSCRIVSRVIPVSMLDRLLVFHIMLSAISSSELLSKNDQANMCSRLVEL